MILSNVKHYIESHKYGLKYFDVSAEYDKAIDEVIKYLMQK